MRFGFGPLRCTPGKFAIYARREKWSSPFLMIRIPLALLAVCVAFSSGCGGEPKNTKVAVSPSGEKSPPPATGRRKSSGVTNSKRTESQPRGLPTKCIPVRDICVPPTSYVDRLCRRNFPDVAVYMMGPKQPWTHRFVRVKEAQAVNPISERVGAVPLTFGEEIIILRYKTGANEGGMQVSGTERYEVLRWDGSCASLQEGEFVESMPKQQLRYVAPTWQRLGDKYRAALLQSSAVAEAEETRKADCKGLGLGRPPKCHKAMEDLNGVVAEVVHDGFELPLPE